MQSIGNAAATLKIQSGEGYLTEFVVRKLCLAQMHVSSNGQQSYWSHVGADLRGYPQIHAST